MNGEKREGKIKQFSVYKVRKRITKPQNGSGWKGTPAVICSNPMLKKGHQEQAAQNCIQTAFGYLQVWRLHNLPGQAVKVLGHHHSEKVLPNVQTGLLCLSLWKKTLKDDSWLLYLCTFPWTKTILSLPLPRKQNLKKLLQTVTLLGCPTGSWESV